MLAGTGADDCEHLHLDISWELEQMPSFTWNGGNGDYLDPMQWTPGDVPLYGADTLAAITAGNVSLSGAEPNGITLNLGGPPAAYQAGPALILNNAAFGPQMALDVSYDATLPCNCSPG